MRGAEDHTIINQYFDAIDKLVLLVMDGRGAQAKDEGLCDAVVHLQDVSFSWGRLAAAVLGLGGGARSSGELCSQTRRVSQPVMHAGSCAHM